MNKIIVLLSVFMLLQQSVQAEWRFLFVMPDGFKLVWIPDSTQPKKEISNQSPTKQTYEYKYHNCIRHQGGNACNKYKKESR